ncbi:MULTISPECIES: lipid-binding SYLF domain-containing protein [unclassified Thioalkalivibrio]|uniref:lipid-binding SYLF domain-containing protein n=1 Tax=unclassified Thioalkalivibrio TaxID=2621013 RepID=UPI00035E8887|nr:MULTISPECIES: lipid-binding SYLF domain-containing protein [unclassified Thioalkalivibrio]
MPQILALLLFVAFAGAAQANPFSREIDPQDIIDRAQATVENMATHPEYESLKEDLRDARGVVIFPRVARGAFLIGGSGGIGVFLAWDDERGDYSPVAFYSLGSVSFGMQFGGDAAEVVMVARTQDAVDSMFGSAIRLGADASVAAGPVGAGRSATPTADFLSYSRARGAYLGMSLSGSRMTVRDDFNEAYYGESQRPVHIIETRRVDREGTRALRETLAGFRADAADEEPAPADSEARGQERESSGGVRPDNFEVESF